MQANYGRDKAECIAEIKHLYEELQLDAAFQAYEQESYDSLSKAIQKQSSVPPAVFTAFLQKIHKRTK